MKTIPSSFLIRVVSSLFLFLPFAQAFDEPASCYQILFSENPAHEANSVGLNYTETWCYQKVSKPSPGSVYIYNADKDEVRPELAFIVEPDGTMTHNSLLADKITTHHVNASEFNPFSVPLEEPIQNQSFLLRKDPKFHESALKNYEALLSHERPSSVADISPRLTPGRLTGSSSITPWRGYWWPFNSALILGPHGKYDRYVAARTGSNPGAVQWERTGRHRPGAHWWGGHCNGWVSSAVLRSEPRTSKRDPVSGVTFTVADQKGLLAEVDYCTHIAFFGERYNDSSDTLTDINPALFHRTITHYIGTLRKPVAIDYRRDAVVDNHIVTGYTIDIRNAGANTYSVTANLRVRRYDRSPNNPPGPAPTYTRQYRYTLRESSSGALSGTWNSTNPDFLWVPLSIRDCANNNPRVTHGRVAEILNL